MKSIKFLFAIILLSFINPAVSFGQTTTSLHKVFVPTWIGLGYAYEHSLAEKFTLETGVEYRTYVGDDDFAADNFIISPRIYIEPKFYYNLARRTRLGKQTINNSGNYLSLDVSYEVPRGFSGLRDFPQSTFRVLPTWGMKRVYKSKFGFEFKAYLGYKLREIGNFNYTNQSWDQERWTDHKIAYGIEFNFNYNFQIAKS